MSEKFQTTQGLRGDKPAAASPETRVDRMELAAIAFEWAQMPMVITDPTQPDNPIVQANQAFLNLTGYRADEVLGRNCRFLQGEGTSAAVVAEIGAAVAEPRDASVELLNYRKDGSPYWSQVHISPLLGGDGRPRYFLGSQVDVTALHRLQRLEASERRLLKEVDHRARNVLALVSGIVRLSRADDPGQYAKAVQRRVQALADAHTLLAECGWDNVPLDKVVMQQVGPFVSGPVDAVGPNVMVSPTAVQPLTLAIHELAVNAATHGALSTHSGSLLLRWEATSVHGGFELNWLEQGGPRPPENSPSGFGGIMLRRMIQTQLRGQFRLQWTADGLLITISLPGHLNTRRGEAEQAESRPTG